MTKEKLERANQLHHDIRNLKIFIEASKELGFVEKLFVDKRIVIGRKALPNKVERDEGYKLSKPLSRKVAKVLQEQVDEWEEELRSIFKDI